VAKKKTTSSRSSASTGTPKKKATPKQAVTKNKTAAPKVVKKAPTKKKPTKKDAAPAPAKKQAKAPVVKKKSSKKTEKKVVASKPTMPPAKTNEQLLEEEMDQDWTVAKLKRVKTGLNKKDLDEFLQLLLEKRSEIIGNVQGMEDARNASLGDIAHMPLHMADVGSDNFEQEFTLGLMESEREMLREIEDALVRMREGYYGVCLDSGRPIDRMRLEFAPWAKYCIEVARMREKRGW